VSVTGLLLAALLLPGVVEEDGYTYPPLTAGEVTAELTVRIEERGPAPGLARVLLTVTVTGPAGLEVAPLSLEDSFAAWKVRWQGSGCVLQGDRTTWEQAVEIVQKTPGVVSLPGVRLPYQTRPGGRMEAFRWDDLLREPRDMPDIEELPPPPQSPWPKRLRGGAAVLAVLAVLAALVGVARRVLRRRPVPLALHERALQQLAAASLPPEDDPAAYHDRLAGVLRNYVAERFALSPARTTGELLAAAEAADLGADARSLLGEVLSACDLVKFAGARPGGEACRRAVEQARAFIQATRPVELAGEAGRPSPAREESRAG
jgi:hypothetical protein